MRKNPFLKLLGTCFLVFCFIGIAQAESFKKIIIWDVDGVVVDSARETYVVSIESLKRYQKEIREIFGCGLKEYSYEEFYSDRPFVKKAYEYFLHAFSRSFMNLRADQLSDEERKEFHAKHYQLFERLTETFYSVRKEFQSKDMNFWYGLNPVYPGIPEAMQQLSDEGFGFVVMSSKDKLSILSLLKYHGLAKHFDENMIFDKTTGKDRQEQMGSVLKKIGVDRELIIVDDLPEQLAASRIVLEGKKAQYLGAKWGYGTGWEKYPFVRIVEKAEDLSRVIEGSR